MPVLQSHNSVLKHDIAASLAATAPEATTSESTKGAVSASKELTEASMIAGRFVCGVPFVETRCARIYHGWDTVANKAIVLKRLKRGSSLRRITEMRREGVLLKMVQHPGLLKGEGYFHWKRNHWLIMEPAKGTLLLDLMKSGQINQLSEQVLRKMVTNIALALQQLHHDGWEHGDIKPDNLFVNRATGVIQLIDYSSTHRLGRDRANQSYSPEWQHPDIVHRKVDTTADGYALGLLTWSLWTGKHPFMTSSGISFKSEPAFWSWHKITQWRNGFWLRKALRKPGALSLIELEHRFGEGVMQEELNRKSGRG
ncbi:serine/threonine protein kinase [Spongorhabdus nitratireducens]